VVTTTIRLRFDSNPTTLRHGHGL